jgi:hypothetical protein
MTTEKFGVYSKGGSIGGNKSKEPVKVHDNAEDAKAHAKRLNKLVSTGEKAYYGVGHHVKESETKMSFKEFLEGSFYGNEKMLKAAHAAGSSTSTVRGKDAKGVYTATLHRKQGSSEHKEIKRVYESEVNERDDREDDEYIEEGSGPKEKQKTPFKNMDGFKKSADELRDKINSDKRKDAADKIGKKVTKESIELDESPFDWKKDKSVIDWHDGKKKEKDSVAAGGVHKARNADGDENFKDRNAETGGAKAKQNVGRPAGKYDKDYKIDRAKRDTPEYKAELSKKVMAAKADNFKVRGEFKQALDAGIKKRQLEIAGIDPSTVKHK